MDPRLRGDDNEYGDEIAKDRSVSRAALIREAVQHLIKTHKRTPISAFGILKDTPMIIDRVEYKDSVGYIRKLREEWDRR